MEKKTSKIYCGECRYFEHEHGQDRCYAHPKTISVEYIAPGQTTLHRKLCAEKNRGNNCPDFKQESYPERR